MSDGQWTPTKILPKETKKLKTINTAPSVISKKTKEKDIAKRKDVWPDGNDGYSGFLINKFTLVVSGGRFLL